VIAFAPHGAGEGGLKISRPAFLLLIGYLMAMGSVCAQLGLDGFF
jgi:hypothetical protein